MAHLSPRDYITIRGARQHNLKGFDLALPKRRLVVVTGPSGSGKSSLAFDTIFAEGQRRYMESLSSYARQFLERMDKPDVDFINGLAPAIAIEQRGLSKNPRSTVATQTEIYDHLRLLYAQIGKIISPISGREVTQDTPRSVANTLQNSLPDGTRFYLTFPAPSIGINSLFIDVLKEKGFHRLIDRSVLYEEEKIRLIDLNEPLPDDAPKYLCSSLVLFDRLVVRKGDDKTTSRVADSAELAFREGNGDCFALIPSAESRDVLESRLTFCQRLELDGMEFAKPHPKMFSFTSPLGACRSCNGHGSSKGVTEALAVPKPKLSLSEGALKPLEGSSWSSFKDEMLQFAKKMRINTEVPYEDLSKAHRHVLWHGDGARYKGLFGFFQHLERFSRTKKNRMHRARFIGFGKCFQCNGARLCEDALYVQVGGKHIGEVGEMTIQEAKDFFDHLELSRYDQEASEILLHEIRKRLSFLIDVGLDYITLGRLSETLSGGESQRIRLATALGSALVGALYVLDEPTIGLHPRDTLRLVEILKQMRDLGNTVIVVEHDPDVIRSADHIVDLGPESGTLGGELIFQGPISEMIKHKDSRTGAYISGNESIPVPKKRRRPDWKRVVDIKGANLHNLKNLNVKIPLEVITCVTGVSGSGKSTLVKEILYQGLRDRLEIQFPRKKVPYRSLKVHSSINAVQIVDQSPIGRSSRSNPVTYVKAFDVIRHIFSNTPQSKLHNYQPGFFSFNIPGGRCDECNGEGTVTVEMQFLADLHLPCEECNGTRYGEEVLHILYKGKNIHDVLNMTVDQALEFFSDHPRLCQMLHPLQTIGLGYLKLGQPAPTLSGGEAQRIKLASCLVRPANYHVFYVFDEPTTGLHFVDVRKLIHAFEQLADARHTVVIIEHNLDTLKCADHIIDLGPEGGAKGGRIVASGTPEQITRISESHTGRFLAPLLASD